MSEERAAVQVMVVRTKRSASASSSACHNAAVPALIPAEGTSVPTAAATPSWPSQMETPVLGACQTDNAVAHQRSPSLPFSQSVFIY